MSIDSDADSDANLSRSRDAERLRLSQVNLGAEELSAEDLSVEDLSAATLRDVDLRAANLRAAELSDAELFMQLKLGQQQVLGILYDRYGSLVYRLALRMLLRPQDAEDLTQEIFLILWRRPNYDSTRGSLSSYLTTLTRSRVLDRLRSQSSNLRLIQRWGQIMSSEPPVITPFEAASLNQRAEQVRAALATLPEQHRQVLELAYYDGLSQSEIARQLNIPLGTIKTWSRQGLLNLRKTLQAFFE